jgi:hypothetical protein
MVNTIIANYLPLSSNHEFSAIWKMTRALKNSGWTYKSSGNGTSKDTSGLSSNDLWGANANALADTYTAINVLSTGSQNLPAATINTATNPATAGFPTSGTILVATAANGWQTITYTGLGATSFTGCSGGIGTIPTNSQIGNNAISVDQVAGWWNAQGPSTLKMPLAAAQSPGINGSFIRGENISQAVTGAKGELLGYLFDASAFSTTITSGSNAAVLPQSVINVTSTTGFYSSGTILVTTNAGVQTVTYTGTNGISFTGCSGGTGTMSTGGSVAQGQGYLVVQPRVDGYGADPHGWDHTHVITGDLSGASVTPSATAIEFFREIVIWKQNTTTSGTVYYQCVDGYAESTSRFSSLSTSTGCTGIIAPAGGGTNNGFPTAGTFVIEGTGGVNTPSNWFGNSTSINNIGKAAIVAVNNVYGTGVSADGSFTLAIGTPFVNAGSYMGFAFTRVDNQEDGDVDPYVWYCPTADAIFTPSRTAQTTTFTTASQDLWQPQNVSIGNNYFRFWRRRGWGGVNDSFQNGTFGLMTAQASATVVISQNNYDREKLANTYNDTYVLEDVWCISYQALLTGATPVGKIRKGSCRWLKAVQGGVGGDLYGGKLWLQLANANTTQTYAFVIGPWDGVSVQVQA